MCLRHQVHLTTCSTCLERRPLPLCAYLTTWATSSCSQPRTLRRLPGSLQRLAETAADAMALGVLPQMDEVLACLHNIQQLAVLLREPGRRFRGPSGEDDAAMLIQAHWR